MGPPWLIWLYVPKRWALTGSLRPCRVCQRLRGPGRPGQSAGRLRSPSGLSLPARCSLLLPSLALSFLIEWVTTVWQAGHPCHDIPTRTTLSAAERRPETAPANGTGGTALAPGATGGHWPALETLPGQSLPGSGKFWTSTFFPLGPAAHFQDIAQSPVRHKLPPS